MANIEQQRERLIGLLKELFQLDQPDLDFGFYRIMHAKSGEVLDFLENGLLSIIRDAFGEAGDARISETHTRLKIARQEAADYGVPEQAIEDYRPVEEARKTYEVARDSGDNEGDIYDHLYRFFERYYDQGDFMSRRYFARETDGKAAPYAVPYDGREVYLHWANRDQYYIKTSEYLTNFTFDPTQAPEYREAHGRLFEGKALKVHCRIIAASEGEHNNVKASAQTERYFIIHNSEPVKLETGESGEPELVIQFEYRADPGKKGQEGVWRRKRLEEAAERIKAALGELDQGKDYVVALMTPAPTEKEKNRTLLEKYIGKYAARNTMDYFIHKDLGGFLRRELDFYIKNEVMRLDDIESANAPRVDAYLVKLKVLRKIARHLIDFLAQLENFQKKLWLKKKFVVDTQYCITLDRVPEEYYSEIAANVAQRREWVTLFAIDELDGYSEPLSEDFLKTNPFLVLDTAFFSAEFKDTLVASMQRLDENLNGLLIHSENFQALGLMQEKYKEQVKCVYIDPPYNTGNDGFFYKDNYQRSSWLAMIYERIVASMRLFNENTSLFASIDDNEVGSLTNLINDLFGYGLHVTNIAARINPRGRTLDKYIAKNHEYITTFSLFSGDDSILETPKGQKALSEYRYTDNLSKYRALELRNRNPVFNRINRPKLYYPIYTRITGGEVSLEKDEEFSVEIFPVNSKGEDGCWTWGKEKAQREKNELFAKLANTGAWRIFRKDRINGEDIPTTKEKSIWLDREINNENGKELIGHMFGKVEVTFPKAAGLIEKIVRIGAGREECILDYFAGSGTTGHAVVNLNREDGGQRKYIMVEMGNYFDDVTRPRMQKVVYSKDWKDGKPVSRDGLSHAFKYIRLESYEDTQNNLTLKNTPGQKGKIRLQCDYLFHYWLDFETRGSPSLLNTEKFVDPAAYKLKVKNPGTDEYVEKTVDLVETFNWLIGLHVEHLGCWHGYDAPFRREQDPKLPEDKGTCLILDGPLKETDSGVWRFRKVEGYTLRTPGDLADRERTLVIWRKLSGDMEKDNLMLDEWFKQRVSACFDVIYVNGSNNLLNLRQSEETWTVRLIEEYFHRAMWDVED